MHYLGLLGFVCSLYCMQISGLVKCKLRKKCNKIEDLGRIVVSMLNINRKLKKKNAGKRYKQLPLFVTIWL